MYQNIPLQAYYRPHTVAVYAVITNLKGDTEVSETLTATVKGRAYIQSSAVLDAALGSTDQDRFKVILPLKKDDGTALTVKYGYKLTITLEDGSTRKLKIERVMTYPESHIEVEAVDAEL